MGNLTGAQVGADVHCHVAEPILTDRMLCRAGLDGVSRLVLTAAEPGDFPILARFARQKNGLPELWTAFGIHPWKIKSATEDDFRELSRRLEGDPNAAVGEIGLDFAHGRLDTAQKEGQKRGFRRQLEMARRLNRPVVVHSVRTKGETMRELALWGEIGLILLHGFAENALPDSFGPLAEKTYFSFSPRETNDANHKARQIIERVAIERILIESDWPSTGIEPAQLTAAAEKIASIRQIRPETFFAQLRENEERFFQQWKGLTTDRRGGR